MNIELVSNTKPKYREKNFTNDFEVPLQQPIDGTGGKTLEITEFSYPLTTKNILDDECSFQVKLIFRDVRKITSAVDGIAFGRLQHNLKQSSLDLFKPSPGEVTMTMDKITLPSGSYDLTTIVSLLNRHMNPNGISVEQDRTKRIKFYFDSVVRYYYQPFSAPIIKDYTPSIDHLHRHSKIVLNPMNERDGNGSLMAQGLVTTLDDGPLFEYRLSNIPRMITYEVTLSKKMAFILGFEKDVISKDVTGVEAKPEYLNAVIGDYIPNVNASDDRLFVYCDEVEPEIVGDAKTTLMLSAPRYSRDHGDGGVATYTPTKIIRKLKRKRIDQFNISVRNALGELVQFDSGTVSLKTVMRE